MPISERFQLVIDATTQGLEKGFNRANFAITALSAALAALGVGIGLNELAKTADSYTNLAARIKIATEETGNFIEAMAGVQQVALATNSNLTSTADLFVKINNVTKDMGMAQSDALQLTKTVTQAIQIGGSSAEAAEAAVVQFIQAMQGGVLRGEEFNSIMEGGFGLAEALARGLSVTTGELRKMAENGELTAERVIKALSKQAEQVQAIYDKFPTTIANALQRISTSWEILIGKMDQSNGASATVASWLVTLADNIADLDILLRDIGQGFVWIGDRLANIDSSTISAIKSTLSELYEIIKKNIAESAVLGEIIWSAFTTALDGVSPLFAAITSGTDEVSSLEVALNMLRLAFAAISDVAAGFNVGLKLLLSGVQFLSGGLYALNSQILDFLGFDTLAQQALNASDRMFAQAEKNGNEAVKLAENHKWAVVQTYEDISKTQEQKNADAVADSQKTLDEILTQEQKHQTDYKVISDERLKLEQQLADAKKTGNEASVQLALTALDELAVKEQSYQTQSKRLLDEKLRAVQDYAQAAVTANNGILSETLKTDLATKGYIVTLEKAGEVAVSVAQKVVATSDVNKKILDDARKGAATLGVDLDIALGRLSEKFIASQTALENFAKGMPALGLEGTKATDALYLGWQKWLESAKSEAEIEAAKAKLIEFGKAGELSMEQVAAGVQATKLAIEELPDTLDPVEQAFERLGIKTKEQLKLSAELAMNDFKTIMESGQATQEGLQEAYEKTIRLAYLSGDAQVIAAANAKAAYLGLQVQIDETGKATVKSFAQIEREQQKLQQSTVSSTPTQAKTEATAVADDDYWEKFKKRRAEMTAQRNQAAQRSSGGGGNVTPVRMPTVAEIAAPVAQPIVNAPLIASSFDIQTNEQIAPTEKKVLELQSANQNAVLEGTPDAVDGVEKMLREFEMLKKGM